MNQINLVPFQWVNVSMYIIKLSTVYKLLPVTNLSVLLRDRGKLSLVAGGNCSLLFRGDPLKLNHVQNWGEGKGGDTFIY